MTEHRRRRGAPAGYLNAALSVLTVLAVLAIALRANSQSPPQIAEFAPQAQQIRTAPQEQTSQVGSAGGGLGGGLPSPQPAPSPPGSTIFLHCVGDPPRQIEDPQSPPCVPYWQGSNGGATSPGVSADAIELGMPSDCQTSTGSGESATEYNDLINFFNERFEFYGRKIVTFCLQTGNGSAMAAGQQADADAMAAHQPPPFASTMYRGGASQYYVQKAACEHHIIAITYYILPRSKGYMDSCAGYIYQYLMNFEGESAALGQWACARLAGGKAVHAGGNDNSAPPRPLTSLDRKFGIILQTVYSDEPLSVQPLRDALAACGITVADKDVLDNPVQDPTASAIPENPYQADNAMLQLKNDGVTSIFCLCNLWTYGAFARASDSQQYYPEWLATSYGGLDAEVFTVDLGQAPADQLAHEFGLTFKPREIPIPEEPYYQAMREVDPGTNPKGPDSVDVEVDQEVYRDLLVLMSGFQMAGPHLTPQTMASGLERAVFPNPDTPLRAGHVGFAGYTYSMTVDAAEFWWGNGQPSPYPEAPGAVCYVDDGVRHAAGQWPRGGDPFFKGPCYGVS